nr:hypothetical protein [Bacilli bacterium]
MRDYIMKYLVVKMYLGYGYSATKEEIDNSIKCLNINVDDSYDEKYITKKNNIYYALYSLDKHIISLENIEYFDLISWYITNNIEKLELTNVDSNNLDRASNIVIYIINALNYIESTNIPLEEIDEVFYKDYKELFEKLSYNVASLLTLSEKDNIEDDVLMKVVSADPKNITSSYKSYCNYKLIDNNLDNILSRSFKTSLFAMVFGTNTYYNMSSYEHDYCFVSNEESMYGPIYLTATKHADPIIEECRVSDETKAKELIMKMSIFNK